MLGESRTSSRGSSVCDSCPSVKIERMVNFVNRQLIFVSSSKSQIAEMLKPNRVKYGTQNPNKSLKMKYHLPLQYKYLSFEQGVEFVYKHKTFKAKSSRKS